MSDFSRKLNLEKWRIRTVLSNSIIFKSSTCALSFPGRSFVSKLSSLFEIQFTRDEKRREKSWNVNSDQERHNKFYRPTTSNQNVIWWALRTQHREQKSTIEFNINLTIQLEAGKCLGLRILIKDSSSSAWNQPSFSYLFALHLFSFHFVSYLIRREQIFVLFQHEAHKNIIKP